MKKMRSVWGGVLVLVLVLVSAFAAEMPHPGDFKAGWSQADITPDVPVLLAGQFYARVSQGVKNPIVATVLALESLSAPPDGRRALLISCDLSMIPEALLAAVRDELQRRLPELPATAVLMNATHTHTAPYGSTGERYRADALQIENPYGLELPAMKPHEFIAFAAPRIADAAVRAWQARQPAGLAYGLGQAVVGRNRLVSYRDGSSRMYGRTALPEFSHIEGHEDHALHLLASYDVAGKLTGVVINLACPTQSWEHGWQISADYWHEIRSEIWRRFNIHALAQVSAAGDQSPHCRFLPDARAEKRMQQLAGITPQQDIARRVVDEVARLLPLIAQEISWNPIFRHQRELVALPRRRLSEKDVAEALAEGQKFQAQYEQALAELQAKPELRNNTQWVVQISQSYSRARRGERVRWRFEQQQRQPDLQVEMHALRLGDVAIVTNPFELYLDYGMQIKAHSPALQTFVVQLAGPGSYVPTARSIAGGAYGAVPGSTEIGVEGGQAVVDWSVKTIRQLWQASSLRQPLPCLGPEIVLGDSEIRSPELKPIPVSQLDSSDPPAISALLTGAWSDRELYLAVRVDDRHHVGQTAETRIWNGDAIQFMLASLNGEPLVHAALALTAQGSRSENLGLQGGVPVGARLRVRRDEVSSVTWYEMLFPLEALGLHPERQPAFRFNLAIFNDNDGKGQDGKRLELSPGLVGGLNPDLFQIFTLAR